MKSRELARILNELLNIQGIQDSSLNGLQVENEREIKTVGLAVDISIEVIQLAARKKVDFLIVHHGLFWGKTVPFTGSLYRRVRTLFESDIALYAAHLPLDVHPEFGNSAQIKQVLGWPVTGDFIIDHDVAIGKIVTFNPARGLGEIAENLREGLAIEPVIWNFGPSSVRRLGYISGGGIGLLSQAAEAGLDTLVTGEPKHDAFWTAKEAGINVVLAGHYATETLGVKSLGKTLENQYGFKTVFLDLPTGY